MARSSYDPRMNTPKRLTLPTCGLHDHNHDMRKHIQNAGISSGTGQMYPSGRGATTRQPTSSGMHGSSEGRDPGLVTRPVTHGHTQGCMDHQGRDPGLVTRPVTHGPTSNTGACVASSSTPTGSQPHPRVHVHLPWVAAVLQGDMWSTSAATTSAPFSRCILETLEMHPRDASSRCILEMHPRDAAALASASSTLDSSPAASPPHPPLLHLTHPHLLLLLLASIRSHSHPGRLNTFLAESGQR